MKTAKLGAIFLISIMALAGVGAGYAAWFDTITITGTVSTGDVDLNVRGYSGTWVWKVYANPDEPEANPPENELYRWHGLVPYKPTDAWVSDHFGGATVKLISYAKAEYNGDDAVKMTFDNLFPCQDFVADVIFHYEGSIPAYVFRSHNIAISNFVHGDDYDVNKYSGANWMEDHWLWKHPGGMIPDDSVNEGMWIEAYKATVTLANPENPASEVIAYEKGEKITSAVQLHYCDYIVAEVYVHIIQDNIFQSCSGDFDLNVYAMQWNEYDPDVQAP